MARSRRSRLAVEVFGEDMSAEEFMNEIEVKDVQDLAENELWPSLDLMFDNHDYTMQDCLDYAQELEAELAERGIPIEDGHKAIWLVAASIKSGKSVQDEYKAWKQEQQ